LHYKQLNSYTKIKILHYKKIPPFASEKSISTKIETQKNSRQITQQISHYTKIALHKKSHYTRAPRSIFEKNHILGKNGYISYIFSNEKFQKKPYVWSKYHISGSPVLHQKYIMQIMPIKIHEKNFPLQKNFIKLHQIAVHKIFN
jgi:hypothetical protein